MNRHSDEKIWFFLLAMLLVVTSSPSVLADAGSDEAVSEPAAADSPPSVSLGQFPKAEIAPASQSQAGLNFPKVKTDDDARLAKKFAWWPSDAQPGPVKDPGKSGYWWWPDQPGRSRPWGNQGYVYVRKVIFDYKSVSGEMKPSLVIKKVLKNVKVLFDFDKSLLREDAQEILRQAVSTLERNPRADILVTGNADIRGSEQYNLKLGERRAVAVGEFLGDHGVASERIRVLSRGKLDALAPSHDLVGLQRDRNAQFMIAEVEEVMIPASQAGLYQDKRLLEERREVESAVKVATKDYVIQAGDTLWKIAAGELGDGRHWKRLYEFNKDVISNPNRPRKGAKIRIPVE